MLQAPVSLRRTIEAVLPTTGTDAAAEIPAALRAAAQRLLERAKAGPPTREAALYLLAADALITYACEADAEPRHD